MGNELQYERIESANSLIQQTTQRDVDRDGVVDSDHVAGIISLIQNIRIHIYQIRSGDPW